MPRTKNRIVLGLTRSINLNLRNKLRSSVIQVFGEETFFDVEDNGHCGVFNVGVYWLGEIKLKHLAWRKLLNLFKWVEWVATFLLEVVMSYVFYKILGNAGLLLNIPFYLCLGILRRVLAPARYVIRPFLYYAKTDPKKCFSLLMAAVLLTALIFKLTAISQITIAYLAIHSAIAVLSVQIALPILIGLAILTSLQKIWVSMTEMLSAIDMSREAANYKISLDEKKKTREYPTGIFLKISKELQEIMGYNASSQLEIKQITSKKIINKQYTPFSESDPHQEFIFGDVKILGSEGKPSSYKKVILFLEHKEKGWQKPTTFILSDVTPAITETLHGLSSEITEIRLTKDQGFLYQCTLFLGVESLFFPAKRVLEFNFGPSGRIEAPQA